MDDQCPDSTVHDVGVIAGEPIRAYPTLQSKIRRATGVIRTAFDRFESPGLLWTGGKDSTLALAIAVQVADELEVDPPVAVFPDHLQHFTEIHTFVECWAEEWDLDLVVARNDSVGAVVRERGLARGDAVPIDELSDRNRWHVRRILGCETETFPFSLDAPVGDYLLRELPLNDTLNDSELDALITGRRRSAGVRPNDGRSEATADENGGASQEAFFSARGDSDRSRSHHRVNPILPFSGQDVWNAFFSHVFPSMIEGYPDGHRPDSPADLPDGIEPASLPIPSLYFDGFRFLGSERRPERPGDAPAWNQGRGSTRGYESTETPTNSHAASGGSYATTGGVDAERARDRTELSDQSNRQGSL